MQKRKGRLGPFYHVNDDSGRMGGRRSPIERTSLWPYLLVSAPSIGVLNVHEAKKVLLLVQNEERMCEIRSFDQRPLPTSVYH